LTLGVPHQAEKDDEYMGEKIAAGTIVLACEWLVMPLPPPVNMFTYIFFSPQKGV